MKRFISTWNRTSLIKRIAIGVVIGAVLGLLVPKFTVIGLLGDMFVGGLKAIAPAQLVIQRYVEARFIPAETLPGSDHKSMCLPILVTMTPAPCSFASVIMISAMMRELL